jgi:hypothetical protein
MDGAGSRLRRRRMHRLGHRLRDALTGAGVDGLLMYDKQLHQTFDFMAQGASKPR